jgi:hypothetical protein
MKWRSGGQLTLAAELACGTFVLCFGLAILQRSAVWAIPALAAWAVGYVSQGRANRRHAAVEKELRARNALNYPGIFDNAPPIDLDSVESDELDVFDFGACTYLGRASKRDIKALIDWFAIIPEQGPNDIFILPELVETPKPGWLSPEFVALLQKAFAEREFLVLRWMQPIDANAECHLTNG